MSKKRPQSKKVNDKVEYYIPSPPKEIFSDPETPGRKVLKENLKNFVIEKITYDTGILVYYEGVPYPRRGFPTPEAVAQVNIVKRLFIETVKTVGQWPFLALLMPVFASRKRLTKLLRSFNEVALKAIAHVIIRPEYMTPLASELQGFIFGVLKRMGVDHNVSKDFARVLGCLIEYDNAYRYRLEDLFSQTSSELLKENPRKELRKLFKIYVRKEQIPDVTRKVKPLYRLLSLLLMLPVIKSAIRETLPHTDWRRLQLDEIDRYWISQRVDYK